MLVKILKWARKNDCEWDWKTCANAAGGGYLNVLKWARKNGCPWDASTCSRAAAGGHLEVSEENKANLGALYIKYDLALLTYFPFHIGVEMGT